MIENCWELLNKHSDLDSDSDSDTDSDIDGMKFYHYWLSSEPLILIVFNTSRQTIDIYYLNSGSLFHWFSFLFHFLFNFPTTSFSIDLFRFCIQLSLFSILWKKKKKKHWKTNVYKCFWSNILVNCIEEAEMSFESCQFKSKN